MKANVLLSTSALALVLLSGCTAPEPEPVIVEPIYDKYGNVVYMPAPDGSGELVPVYGDNGGNDTPGGDDDTGGEDGGDDDTGDDDTGDDDDEADNRNRNRNTNTNTNTNTNQNTNQNQNG